MNTDIAYDAHRELTLVRVWHKCNTEDRRELHSVIGNLSAASLADVDIREHLESRLRALESEASLWLQYAQSAFGRRLYAAFAEGAKQGAKP